MKLLLLVAVISAVFFGWNKIPSLFFPGLEPLKDTPYVTVYGRDACGITQRLLADLGQSGIPYDYKIVDDPAVKKELHPRMKQAGLNSRRYGLPVVDVNAEMMMRPKAEVVAKKYAQAQPVGRKDERSGYPKTERRNTNGASQRADPVVPCRINGHDTYTLRSQCPDPGR